MVDWDALEAAGHDLTHCGMLMAGTSLYYCENCGAFMLAGQEGISVFHLPPGSGSTQVRCPHPGRGRRMAGATFSTLKSKLEALREADLERLKDI